MASNRRGIYVASYILYSLILVLNSCSYELSSIFDLIRSITHLIPTNTEKNPKDYTFEVIYPYVMKGAFLYSIAIVLLSTTITFASYSSFRELATAITRYWKPFLASIVAAIIFPAILQPPSTVTLFGTYFNLTQLHALFTVYFTVKLVTMPMLEEKFGDDVQIPDSLSRKFIFWQIAVSTVQIRVLYLSEEAYKMQIVSAILCEVMHLIWLASCYELMVFSVLIYENRTKKELTEPAGTSSSEESESVPLLVDERVP